MKRLIAVFVLVCLSADRLALAQDATPVPTPPPASGGLNPDVLERSFLHDYDGDSVLEIYAFGDSITRGVGDFTRPGEEVEALTFPTVEAGYPLRLERWLGVSVTNGGDPGEGVATGIFRFANIIPSRHPDLVLISEGANDSIHFAPGSSVFHRIQAMVNISRAIGVMPVVGTINTPVQNHSGFANFIRDYNRVIRLIALANNIPLFDTARAFANTCSGDDCALFNLPDGLHPNTAGYDVMGEVASAALLNIDLFAPDGPQQLESALGFSPGTVRTVPDALPAAPTPTPAG